MRKVCIHLATGFEEIEAVTLTDVLRRANIPVEVISMTKDLMVTGAHQIAVTADALFESVNYDEVDMIILPGGMPGSTNLDAHEGLKTKILEFHKQTKKLAAICAAPLVFGRMGILQDQKATCYPGTEKELKGAKILDEPVVVSNHFITGRSPGASLLLGLKLVEILTNKLTADKVKDGIITT
jgi:4-methyl-5(b-hydroxyethyl)-thiazole monophosphate biosynthesis